MKWIKHEYIYIMNFGILHIFLCCLQLLLRLMFSHIIQSVGVDRSELKWCHWEPSLLAPPSLIGDFYFPGQGRYSACKHHIRIWHLFRKGSLLQWLLPKSHWPELFSRPTQGATGAMKSRTLLSNLYGTRIKGWKGCLVNQTILSAH